MLTDVALVDAHVRLSGDPLVIVGLEALIVTVGAAELTVMLAVAVAVPPGPVAVMV
jgi:hypothetical protein